MNASLIEDPKTVRTYEKIQSKIIPRNVKLSQISFWLRPWPRPHLLEGGERLKNLLGLKNRSTTARDTSKPVQRMGWNINEVSEVSEHLHCDLVIADKSS